MINNLGQLHIRMDLDLKQALADDAKANRRPLAAHAAYVLEEQARRYLESLPKRAQEPMRVVGAAEARRRKQSEEWQETLKLAGELKQEEREGRLEGR